MKTEKLRFLKFVCNSPSLLACIGLCLIGILMFQQLLFSGEIINATDIVTQAYFWNVFTKENLFTDPCFQTWLPYINGGTPFSGGLDMVFRPIAFFTLLAFPVPMAINYEIVVYFLLMGLGMYGFMRELKVSYLASFLAALVLMLNGEIVSLINAGHINKIGAIFPTPFVFWALERAIRRKTLRAFLLAGFALGFQFWQSHIQISFYTCIAVGIYFLLRVGGSYRRHHSGRQLSLLMVFGVIMVVVFLLLSAVEFLPLLSFAEVSERAQGVSYDFATSWSMPPEELITYAIPGFFGFRRPNFYEDEQIIPYWGRMPFTQTGRYFGLLPCLFLLFALCFVRNKQILPLAVVAAVALLLGMGKYLPSYKFLYAYVPGFNKFRVPQMILFLFAFSTSALAGFGFQWLVRDFSEPKRKRLRMFLIAGIVLLMLLWMLTALLPQIHSELITMFKDALTRRGGTPELAAARFSNIFRGFLRFNVIFSIALFILGFRLVPAIRIRWFVTAVLLLYLIDIGMFNEKYIDTLPLEESIYVSENDAIRYFKEHPGLYRIFPGTNTPDSYSTSNKYLAHHLFSVSGYEAVGVQYYKEFLQQMYLGSPLLDLMNIKYIILPRDVQLNEEANEVGKIIGPYKIVMHSDALVLENLNYLPRAFPVHQARTLTDKQTIMTTLSDPAFRPWETVILEEPLPGEFTQNQEQADSPPRSQVEITSYFNRTIRLKVNMAAAGFLVLSEKYYPGWKAYVGDRPTKIYKANYTFQAIFLPAGEHDVLFSFQPTQFLLGFTVTTLTLLGLAIVFIVHRRGRRIDNSLPSSDESSVAPSSIPARHSRPHRRFLQILPFVAIGAGALFHGSQYLFNRSLHVDEASLALNILNRSFAQLLQPLDFHQGAPLGFLMIEKCLTILFGDSEYALRLFPLISALLGIGLFYWICSHYLKGTGKIVALTVFVASAPLLIYSSTVKQYSSDALFALLLYASLIRLQRAHFRRNALIEFAGVGALAIWCSHPSVFILAGTGTYLGYRLLRQRQFPTCIRFVSVVLFWLLNFSQIYVISLRHLNHSDYLMNFWSRAFMPFPPSSLAEGTWLGRSLIDFIGYATGLSQAIFDTIRSHSVFRLLSIISHIFSAPENLAGIEILRFALFGALWTALYLLALGFSILGGITLFSTQRETFWLLLAPVGVTVLASALHLFPLGTRLMLFLIPAVCLLIGAGAARLRNTRYSGLALVLIVILLAYPVASATYHIINPRTDQELRPVLEYVEAQRQNEDSLYVYYGAHNMFTYYARRLDLPSDDNVVMGISARENWQNYHADLDQLRGQGRVWIIFSHAFGYEELFFLQYLNTFGAQLDALRGVKASAYLYRFDQQPESQATEQPDTAAPSQ